MSRIKLPAFWGHGLSILIILMLLGYILLGLRADRFEPIMIQVRQDFDISNQCLMDVQQEQDHLYRAILSAYPNPQNELLLSNLDRIYQKSNALYFWLEELKENPRCIDYEQMETTINTYWTFLLSNTESDSTLLTPVPEYDQLQLLRNIWEMEPAARSTIIAQWQSIVLQQSLNASNYWLKKLAFCDIKLDKWGPYFSPKNLNFLENGCWAGEMALGLLPRDQLEFFTPQTTFLNGQKFSFAGIEFAPFQIQIDVPGIHPLQVKIEAKNRLTDTLYVFEKTFFVKVLE